MSRVGWLLATVLGALVAAAAPRLAAQVPPRDSAHLVAITRELVDAITPGDSVVWARTLAPNWFLRDSSGAVTALVNRRDNNAVTWRRVPAQRSSADRAAFPERIRSTRPDSGDGRR